MTATFAGQGGGARGRGRPQVVFFERGAALEAVLEVHPPPGDLLELGLAEVAASFEVLQLRDHVLHQVTHSVRHGASVQASRSERHRCLLAILQCAITTQVITTLCLPAKGL